ncbi:uncharacterized protein LOC131009611 [Salvia miltiorrhiza]|uniref:uncharacterized protein LOC131009611 n=1 Tax=Salvia miltiorrhiza TaxID=226208 RepID=UPI0025AD3CB8|nr:uncharacterized protein LOC131009611 [Salvia miltiorrhiza]
MGEWSDGIWSWNLNWKRELRGRELDQFSSLSSLINSFDIIAGKPGGWRWKADPKGIFSVKEAYRAVSKSTETNFNDECDLKFLQIWKAKAPFKAKMTAWRLLKGRLATTDNLLRRQVQLPNEELTCILCKDQAESIDHLFFSCQMTTEVWNSILLWIGKHAALHIRAKDHLLAFSNLGSKADNFLLTSVWICVIWSVWNWRNEGKFNKDIWSKDKILAEIKTRVWGWKSAFSLTTSSPDFRSWFVGDQILGCS